MRKPLVRFVALAAAALGLALVGTGCESTAVGGGSEYEQYMNYNLPARRASNPSAVRVEVSVQNQAMYVMEGDRPLLVAPLGVGTSSTPTPLGHFRIFNKNATRRANTHGYFIRGGQVIGRGYLRNKPAGASFVGTPMGYWCEFHPAYGFHTGWVHPYPRTHGCLRMHQNVAPKFFQLVSVGTPVHIVRNSPLDATLGVDLPRPPDPAPFPDIDPSLATNSAIFTRHAPVRWE